MPVHIKVSDITPCGITETFNRKIVFFTIDKFQHILILCGYALKPAIVPYLSFKFIKFCHCVLCLLGRKWLGYFGK